MLGSQLSFLNDDWDFLLFRRGFGAEQILEPHNPHIVVVPVLLYKGILAVFGMDSQQPFRVVSIPIFVTSVALLFIWLRRRVGEWLALAGVLPILFLGSAGEILLWPFPQIGFCGPMAAGLGAFLALDRDDRRGDRLACALLTLSILFGSLGTAFVAGAVVHLAWDRERWRRAYVALIPICVYVVWWLGWGQKAATDASLHNLLHSPIYVVEGFGSGRLLAAGAAQDRLLRHLVPRSGPAAARPARSPLAALRIRQIGHVSRWLAVVTVTALGFWLPAALNASEQRDPTEPRYQYMAAIFILMIAAELLRGVRIGRRAMVAVFAVAGVVTLSNIAFLYRAFENERLLGEQSRGALAALEISRGTVDPEFVLSAQNAGVANLRLVSAGPYFSAIDEFGSPAYTPLGARQGAGAGPGGGRHGDLERAPWPGPLRSGRQASPGGAAPEVVRSAAAAPPRGAGAASRSCPRGPGRRGPCPAAGRCACSSPSPARRRG